MWRSEMRAALLSIALLTTGLFAQSWLPQPHYAAPATGAVVLALLFSVRHFRSSQFKHAIWGSRALAIVLAIWMISPIAEALRDPFVIFPNLSGPEGIRFSAPPLPLHLQRAAIQSELERRSGKQLVIVHYPYRYVPWEEWVYNDADIDHAHVIWARDMGYLKNKELLNYYSDRRAWYVDRGDPASLIAPYDQAMAPFKLAYEGATLEKDSPQVASVGQKSSSAIAKPEPVNLKEVAAPRPQ
jgi:hypothetical protein